MIRRVSPGHRLFSHILSHMLQKLLDDTELTYHKAEKRNTLYRPHRDSAGRTGRLADIRRMHIAVSKWQQISKQDKFHHIYKGLKYDFNLAVPNLLK